MGPDEKERPTRPMRALFSGDGRMTEYAPYRVYLVRLWPTRRGGVADYRVTVQDVDSGEREHFADLASLLDFWYGFRLSPGKDLNSREKKHENGTF